MKYTFRVDAHDGLKSDQVKEFFSTYDKLLKSYLIYEEYAEVTKKLHWQGVMELEPDVTEGKVRETIRRYFKINGRGKYSMAQVKEESYEVYITKDKNRLVTKGYTEERIKELEDASYHPEKISNHKVDKDKKKEKLELAFDIITDRILKEKILVTPDREGLRQVYRQVIWYFGKVSHQGFAIKKMKEMSDYVFYNMFEYEQVMFVETNTVTQVGKTRFIENLCDKMDMA